MHRGVTAGAAAVDENAGGVTTGAAAGGLSTGATARGGFAGVVETGTDGLEGGEPGACGPGKGAVRPHSLGQRWAEPDQTLVGEPGMEMNGAR